MTMPRATRRSLEGVAATARQSRRVARRLAPPDCRSRRRPSRRRRRRRSGSSADARRICIAPQFVAGGAPAGARGSPTCGTSRRWTAARILEVARVRRGRSSALHFAGDRDPVSLDAGDPIVVLAGRARRLLRAVRDRARARRSATSRARRSPCRRSAAPSITFLASHGWPTSASIPTRTSTGSSHPAAESMQLSRGGEDRCVPGVSADSAGAAGQEDRARGRQHRRSTGPGRSTSAAWSPANREFVRKQSRSRPSAPLRAHPEGGRHLRAASRSGRRGSSSTKGYADATTTRSRR